MFLANENFPLPSINYLRDNHIDVLSIQENYPGIADSEVLSLAKTLNRTIITFDSDYGELIFKYSLIEPPSVIYFRYKGTDPEYVGKILHQLILERNINFTKSFTVVESDTIRQRNY